MIHVSTNVNASCQNGFVPTPLTLLPTDAVVCCSSLAGDALSSEAADRIAHTFKALGDPTRVRLLSLIAGSQGGEACICDLTEPVGLSQPTVSHHMKVLVEAGLATREQRGRWAYYRVVTETLQNAARALTSE